MAAETQSATTPHPALTDYYGSDRERRTMLDSLFDRSAGSYDRITQWLSFGTGRWHRSQVLKRAGVKAGTAMLDIACGTGQVTLEGQALTGETGYVIGLDASFGMLQAAKARGGQRLSRGMAEQLPFPDATFDVVSMGYALRHARDLETVFAEYRRVLKPGGRLVLMEIARPESRLMLAFARLYMKTIVPKITRVSAEDPSAGTLMSYYWDTIEHCVPAEAITAALNVSGFDDIRVDRWFSGLIKDYHATRLL
jgi:demethylmenaquinone methyltransferase/2-methoxy-6-polyprenyl-1,4-benzoquinol methylase